MPELATVLNAAPALLAVGGLVYYAGRLTRTLEGVQSICKDHEARLRALEGF